MSEASDEWEKRHESTPIPVHIVAGSLAGMCEHISMLPFDNIKTRLQVFPNTTFL